MSYLNQTIIIIYYGLTMSKLNYVYIKDCIKNYFIILK